MEPWKYEVGACVHAMLYVRLERIRDRHGCGYVKGEGRYLTCNMSCIRLVGGVVDDADVIVGADVADTIGAGSEVVPRMEQGSMHLDPHNKDLHSIRPLLARYS